LAVCVLHPAVAAVGLDEHVVCEHAVTRRQLRALDVFVRLQREPVERARSDCKLGVLVATYVGAIPHGCVITLLGVGASLVLFVLAAGSRRVVLV